VTLLHAAGLRLSFGSRTVFDDLTLTIEEGERVGLVGVNGSGKSSLMKILARAAEPDRGELQLKRGAAVTYLPQEPEFAPDATVASELEVARAPLKAALDAHAALSARLEVEKDESLHEKLLHDLSALSERVEHLGGWDTAHEARRLLDRLGVKDWDRRVTELSGGTRKRVAIARAILARPDLLLLDEPTNHLDADTVDWLEEELDEHAGALLLVTHDRYFLDDLVDRILEITPGEGVTSYPGNYETYLEQKLVAEEQAGLASHKRDQWIAQEVAWLRRGPEARRTKSKARIDRARKLMAESGFQRPKVAEFQMAAPPRLSAVVLEAEGLVKRFGDRTVLDGIDFRLKAGERVGLVGPNGVGKTTFLKVLLGELEPDGGTLTTGKKTRVAYYDQQRTSLDGEQTVYQAAGGGSPGWHGEDFIDVGGRKVALRDYLDDLLFPPSLQKLQVKALSGGERNRLLLARLFLEGANVLVLDEPTNDLDLVTLNVLERLLLSFEGSVLLVTHDRYFLDKVATAILAFEGEGKATRWEGNYDLYRRLKAQAEQAAKGERAEAASALAVATKAAAAGSKTSARSAPAAAVAPAPARKPGKLSFKDQREYDGIEAAIKEAEARKAALEASMADPATYQRGGTDWAALRTGFDQASSEVERLYARWEALEALKSGG
jgi:ATP-binding cassette subfamily F protein uup